ncbi:MAG: Endonuclease III [candidate division WS2 bacterium]|nr:Endonuclease III [Candidatus Lithacetigena glycinireducens]
MKDKKTADKVIKILEDTYPDARTMLNYKTPIQLLVAVILSAQCTDERVNKVTAELFKKYKTVNDFASANLMVFEQEINSVGFYQNKAKNIINCCRIIIEKFKGKIPDNMDDLISLPGVGRKTASVVLANIYNIPSIAVDTHVRRVSQRLGFTSSDNPDIIEKDLSLQIEKSKWIKATKTIGFCGRYICQARKPKCDICNIRQYCDYANIRN